MKRSIFLIALLLGGIVLTAILPALGPAVAADSQALRNSTPARELPFPRSERAAAVWAAGTCWSECGAYCAWGQSGCLERDAQGLCLRLTDACDRYCQRQCRTISGPALPIDFFWE